jgi:hypothetical protein
VVPLKSDDSASLEEKKGRRISAESTCKATAV